MNTFFEQMMNDPMFWKIASVIIILILVASFKKLFKLASLLFLIIVVYAGYLIMTGTEPDEIVEQLQESSEDVWDKAEASFDEVKDFTEDVVEDVVQDANKEIEKQVKQAPKKKKKKSITQKFKDKEDAIMKKFKEEEDAIMKKFDKMEKL